MSTDKKVNLKKMKKKISLVNLLYCLLVLEILVVSILNAYVGYFVIDGSGRNAVSTVSLAYDGATSGLNPRKGSLSVEAIKSEEVIESALVIVGMSGQYSASAVAKCIDVTGVYPKNIVESVSSYDSVLKNGSGQSITVYYPTTYNIVVYDYFDKKISNKNLKALAGAIAEAYKNYFVETYSYELCDDASGDVFASLDDYSDEVDAVSLRIQQLSRLASKLYDDDANIAINGISFKSIVERCSTLQSISVSNLLGYIQRLGLTKYKAKALVSYYYRISVLQNDVTYINSQIDTLQTLTENYKIDTNKYLVSSTGSELYESKTEATYAELVNQKATLNTQINEINREISNYQARIDDIEKSTMDATLISYVNSELNLINSQLKNIEDDFEILLNSYNEKIIPESSIIISNEATLNKKSIFSISFVVRVVKASLPLVFVFLFIVVLEKLIKAIRKSKAEKTVSE